MGTLTSTAYDVTEGREYVGYLDRVLKECVRLRAEGRLPDGESVDAFLDDAQLVLHAVRQDVASASARGVSTIQSQVRLTAEEHKRYLTMGESLRNLLEILELRKALVLDRTPAVGRVAESFYAGTFTP